MGFVDDVGRLDQAFAQTPAMGGMDAASKAQYELGRAKGWLMGQENARANNEDRRRDQLARHEDEEFGWKRLDKLKAMEISGGMAQASQQGGYNGVIDYLKTKDPKMALEFEKQKVGLDRDIMENDTYKLAHTNDKAKVMVEGYEILGKMYHAVEQAPADERDTVYQAMLPMIQQVNPNAPTQYDNSAQAMGLLATAQAMPENMLFANKQTVFKAQSEIGKLQADIDMRIQNGETSETSAGLKNLMNTMAGKQAQSENAQMSIEQYKYTQLAQQQAAAKDETTKKKIAYSLQSTITKDYESKSKPYIEYLSTATKINTALDVIAQTPKGQTPNPAALQALQSGVVKANAGAGPMTETDFIRFGGTAAGYANVQKNLNALSSGTVVPLLPKEIEDIKEYYHFVNQNMQEKQAKVNNHYQNILDDNGLPRKALLQYQAAPKQAIQELNANRTQESEQQFKQVFGYVPDPEE